MILLNNIFLLILFFWLLYEIIILSNYFFMKLRGKSFMKRVKLDDFELETLRHVAFKTQSAIIDKLQDCFDSGCSEDDPTVISLQNTLSRMNILLDKLK